jgi:hypothetical protein
MHLQQGNAMTSSTMTSLTIGHRSAKPLGWAILKKSYANTTYVVAVTLILTGFLSFAAAREAVAKRPAIQPASQAGDQTKGMVSKGMVSSSEFDLSGLSFYTLKEDILALLGPPKSRDIAPTAYIDEVLYYGGISIAIAGGQVWDIIATSPKFCTPSGVCPGDSVDYVFDILGATDITQSDGGERATYTAPDTGCSLNLDIVADTVSQIGITCP